MRDERFNEDSAIARGYAWAAIDFGGKPVAAPATPTPADMAFAEAYAAARQATRQHLAGYAPSVQEAFANWQASGGRTVFRD